MDQQFDLKQVLVANTKSLNQKLALRKKRMGVFRKQSNKSTIDYGKQNRVIKPQKTHIIHAKIQQNKDQQSKILEPYINQCNSKLKLQQMALQNLHLLSIDVQTETQEPRLLSRWYNQSTDFVLRKQQKVRTPQKSTHIFRRKVQSQKTKVPPIQPIQSIASWQITTQQKLFRMTQDGKLLCNLKNSSLMKNLKLSNKRYQSNLFDFVNSKIIPSRRYESQRK